MAIFLDQNRNCPLCNSSNKILALDFPNIPLGDNFSNSKEQSLLEISIPLNLVVCKECSHTFLTEVINPDLTYLRYYFRSATSPGLANSMDYSAKYLMNLTGSSELTIVDIGANDGTWLSKFKFRDNTFAVEPSPSHWEELETREHDMYKGYFSSHSVENIKSWLGNRKLDLVTVNNTLSNISNLNDFFENLVKLDTGQTTFSIITGYHIDQFNANMFDYIYHEHLSYFTVTDLVNFGKKFGFTNFYFRRFPLKGGSIQVSFNKGIPDIQVSEELKRFMAWENWITGNPELYAQTIMRNFNEFTKQVTTIADKLSKNGNKLVGYGYSHSVATLLIATKLCHKISRLVDDDKNRQGLFTPYLGYLIENPSTIKKEENVFILAWQHDKLIERKLRTNFPDSKYSNPSGSVSNI